MVLESIAAVFLCYGALVLVEATIGVIGDKWQEYRRHHRCRRFICYVTESREADEALNELLALSQVRPQWRIPHGPA